MRLRLFGIVALLCLCVCPLAGQGPPPGTPPGKPWTDAMVAESLVVLRRMDSVVTKSKRDASVWYRRGMLAWGLAYRDKVGPPYTGLDWTRLLRTADSSMRQASDLAPNNARIVLSTAQFFVGTGTIAMRVGSYRMFERALKEARRGRDTALLAEALIEQARVQWRRYDALANRRLALDESDGLRRLQAFMDAGDSAMLTYQRDEIMRNVNDISQPLGNEFSGLTEYARAEALFTEAYEVAPRDARAFRQLGMLLAERRRWRELASFARSHLARIPRDAPALFALGLAQQRQRQTDAAQVAFDSALAVSSPAERDHITNLARVISPGRARERATLDAMVRFNADQAYWLFNDPLWSRGGDDARTEFLARATFADLRWTVEELGVRGIDSDRGEMHVRYGPPDLEFQLGPKPIVSDLSAPISTENEIPLTARPFQVDAVMDLTSVTAVWAYQSGLLLMFRSAPTYATARFAPSDQAAVDSIVRATPASWANAIEERILDMPTLVTRFRATVDSVDAYVATEPPVTVMRNQTVPNAPVRVDFWLLSQTNADAYRDSTVLRSANAHGWLCRVQPGGFSYRVESTVDGALIAGRKTDWIDASDAGANAFVRTGFGISDLLLASRVSSSQGARRWKDLSFDPIGGTVTAKRSVVLIWENYDFGQTAGSATYGVKLTIRRNYETMLGRIRARIVAAMQAAVGVEEVEGRVIQRFERTTPHAAVIVENLTIELNDSPPGEYFLTLEITDRMTGRVAERERRIVITP